MVRLTGPSKAFPPRQDQEPSGQEAGRARAAGEDAAAAWHPASTLADFSLTREKGCAQDDMLEERSLSPNEPGPEWVRVL